MLTGIDHLVIAVRDPAAAAAELEAVIGLAVTGGGRHDGRGTYNRLAFLGDTYLELIGVEDRTLVGNAGSFAVGRAAMALLDEGREGLATYALATDDLAGDVARLRAAGSPIVDAVAGSRARADGEVIRWLAAFPELGPARPPFLIEHELVGSEWGPEARTARAGFRHPVGGAVRLTALTLPGPDPAATVARYRETLGLSLAPDGTSTVGGQAIAIVSGGGDASPVVDLTAEPGAPDLDEVRFGIRWRRRSRGG